MGLKPSLPIVDEPAAAEIGRPQPAIAFLVYDSRSGSTLLSREAAETFADTVVTPEIAFDFLLARRVDTLTSADWPMLLDGMYAGHDFFNVPLTPAEALAIVCPSGGAPLGIGEGLVALIEAFAERLKPAGMEAPTQLILVKNGTTIKHWRSLHALLGDKLHLVFMFRDPRGVINSKLKVSRPYHPEEKMAWAGPLLAAWQWSRYSHLAREAGKGGVRVTEVRYETLMSQTGVELARIASQLGVRTLAEKRSGSYRIPVAERGIHRLVEKGGIEVDRIDAWEDELSSIDIARIEALIRDEMRARGYVPRQNMAQFSRLFTVMGGVPSLTGRLVRHAFYTRGRIARQARASQAKRAKGSQ